MHSAGLRDLRLCWQIASVRRERRVEESAKEELEMVEERKAGGVRIFWLCGGDVRLSIMGCSCDVSLSEYYVNHHLGSPTSRPNYQTSLSPNTSLCRTLKSNPSIYKISKSESRLVMIVTVISPFSDAVKQQGQHAPHTTHTPHPTHPIT